MVGFGAAALACTHCGGAEVGTCHSCPSPLLFGQVRQPPALLRAVTTSTHVVQCSPRFLALIIMRGSPAGSPAARRRPVRQAPPCIPPAQPCAPPTKDNLHQLLLAGFIYRCCAPHPPVASPRQERACIDACTMSAPLPRHAGGSGGGDPHVLAPTRYRNKKLCRSFAKSSAPQFGRNPAP